MPRSAPFVRAILALTSLTAGIFLAACGAAKHGATTPVQTLVARPITTPTTSAIEQTKATRGSIVMRFGSITFTRSAKATIWAVKTGTKVTCQAGPGRHAVGISVLVPRRGAGAGGSADGSGGSSAEIELTHQQDGTITVSCRSSR